jgi:hypothetical protein
MTQDQKNKNQKAKRVRTINTEAQLAALQKFPKPIDADPSGDSPSRITVTLYSQAELNLEFLKDKSASNQSQVVRWALDFAARRADDFLEEITAYSA